MRAFLNINIVAFTLINTVEPRNHEHKKSESVHIMEYDHISEYIY